MAGVGYAPEGKKNPKQRSDESEIAVQTSEENKSQLKQVIKPKKQKEKLSGKGGDPGEGKRNLPG